MPSEKDAFVLGAEKGKFFDNETGDIEKLLSAASLYQKEKAEAIKIFEEDVKNAKEKALKAIVYAQEKIKKVLAPN
jgi:hypothetical protein